MLFKFCPKTDSPGLSSEIKVKEQDIWLHIAIGWCYNTPEENCAQANRIPLQIKNKKSSPATLARISHRKRKSRSFIALPDQELSNSLFYPFVMASKHATPMIYGHGIEKGYVVANCPDSKRWATLPR